MRMLLIDVYNREVKLVEASTLEDYYRLLNTDIVEMPDRRIGHLDKVYEIICDEEGKCKEAPKISAVDSNMEPMLVGNLLIAGSLDNSGNRIPLADEDIVYIVQFIKNGHTANYPESYPILTQCEYAM